MKFKRFINADHFCLAALLLVVTIVLIGVGISAKLKFFTASGVICSLITAFLIYVAIKENMEEDDDK